MGTVFRLPFINFWEFCLDENFGGISFVELQSTLGISNTRYLEHFGISNKMLIPLDICYDSALISVRYLEPRYLELFAISNRFLDPLTKLTIKTKLDISNFHSLLKWKKIIMNFQPKVNIECFLTSNVCLFGMFLTH